MHRAIPSGSIKVARSWAGALAWETVTGATPRGRLCAVALLVAALATLGPDRIARGPRLCVISALIRRPCPACGMTRAAAALLRGDLRGARHCNPRILPVAVIALLLLARDGAAVVAHRAPASRSSSLRSRSRSPGAVAAAAPRPAC